MTDKTTSEPTIEPTSESSEQSPTCTAPDGYRLAYILTREAWYSQAPADRDLQRPQRLDDLHGQPRRRLPVGVRD